MSDNAEYARDAVAVTTSDTADNSYAYLYVGGTGNVKVKTEAGTDVTYTAVPVGGYIRVRTQRIYATGTTATLIVGHKY